MHLSNMRDMVVQECLQSWHKLPEINEGAIVDVGGIWGGFESNLKGTKNSTAGLHGPSAEGFYYVILTLK